MVAPASGDQRVPGNGEMRNSQRISASSIWFRQDAAKTSLYGYQNDLLTQAQIRRFYHVWQDRAQCMSRCEKHRILDLWSWDNRIYAPHRKYDDYELIFTFKILYISTQYKHFVKGALNTIRICPYLVCCFFSARDTFGNTFSDYTRHTWNVRHWELPDCSY